MDRLLDDSDCDDFFAVEDLESMTERQADANALSYISLKNWIEKKGGGKDVEWHPWPPSPEGNHLVSDAFTEKYPELEGEFSSEPQSKEAQVYSFKKVSDNALYRLMVGALYEGEIETGLKDREVSMKACVHDDGEMSVHLTGKGEDLKRTIKEVGKFPVTLWGSPRGKWKVESAGDAPQEGFQKVHLRMYHRKDT